MDITEFTKFAEMEEPKKTLVKVGILDECGDITLEGIGVLMQILVKEYEGELKKKADLVVAEIEKEEKK